MSDDWEQFRSIILSGEKDEALAQQLESFLIANPDFEASDQASLGNDIGLEEETSALHRTCRRGEIKTTKVLLDHNQKHDYGLMFYEFPDEAGFDPFRLAVMHNHVALVKLLLENGINAASGLFDPDHTDDYTGFPLEFAASMEMAELLISNGAVVDNQVLAAALGSRGSTNKEIAYMLLEKHNHQFDKTSTDPIEIVTIGGTVDMELLLKLIDKGFNSATALQNIVSGPNELTTLAAIDKLVVGKGVDPNINKPLQMACRHGKPIVAKKLVEVGVKPDAESLIALGTFLQIASPNEEDLVAWFEIPGFDIMEVGNSKAGENALHLILCRGKSHADSVRKLIDMGVPLGAKDKDGNTPLIRACQSIDLNSNGEQITAGHLGAIKELLKHPEVGINERNKKGQTAMHFAPTSDTVDILVQAGADLDIRDDGGNTPLHVRVIAPPSNDRSWYDFKKGFHSDGIMVVPKLLELGADTELTNNYSLTPILAALSTGSGFDSTGRMQLCRYLLSHGINVHAVNPTGCSALHHVSSSLYFSNSEQKELTKLLLDRGADIQKENYHGEKPLLNALFGIIRDNSKDWSYVEFLLNHGANPQKADKNGNSFLHLLCKSARHKRFQISPPVTLFQLLMDKGCDPVAPNFNNDTPIMIYTTPEGPNSIILDVLFTMVSHAAGKHGSASVVPSGIRGKPVATTIPPVLFSLGGSSAKDGDSLVTPQTPIFGGTTDATPSTPSPGVFSFGGGSNESPASFGSPSPSNSSAAASPFSFGASSSSGTTPRRLVKSRRPKGRR